MQYRRFGKTNIMLSALGYGTSKFKKYDMVIEVTNKCNYS
jgi:aryl-alcohol dehydrogenase-like predicted oxidoreductase